jgi:hypothetical protein
MKTWCKSVENEAESYSDAEMQNVIVRSTRRAIYKGYYQLSIWGYISVVMFVVLAYIVFLPYHNASRLAYSFLTICLVILIIGVTLEIFSYRKIGRYSSDTPLRQWLFLRIEDLNRKVSFYDGKKHLVLNIVFGIALLVLFLWGLGNDWMLSQSSVSWPHLSLSQYQCLQGT